MNKSEIKNKIKELELQINSLKEDLSSLFKSELVSLMNGNGVVRIEMRVNNHEFNDGDATSFSLYYEDLSIILSDGREIEPYSESNKDLKNLRQEFVDFFGEFQSIFESEFGDVYESVAFTIKKDKLTWE